MPYNRTRHLGLAMLLILATAHRLPAEPSGERPLVMFIGDSLSVGGRNHPNQEEYPRWSYVEAIKVLAEKDGPYRFDKRAAGGNSICGAHRGLYRSAQSITIGSRNQDPVPGLAIIVFQDSATGHKPSPDEYEPALRDIVGFVEKRPGVRLVLCTTAFERRQDRWKEEDRDGLGAAWHKINEVMLKIANEKRLALIRQDIYWQRYINWYLAKNLPPLEEKKWRLTGEGLDTVHPGPCGSVFMAIQIARDLGIPAESLDVDNPDLPISKEMAVQIRDFVYSWSEPTAVSVAK